DAAATVSVANSVVASYAPGGYLDPSCISVTTMHSIVLAEILVTNAADPVAGTVVAPTQAIEYTLTVTVANSALTQDLLLEDTLGPGLEFDAATSPGSVGCSGPLTCTLPAGSGIVTQS